MGTIVKEKDGRYRVRIRRKVRGAIIDKSARFERMTDARKWDQQIEAEITAGKFFKTVEAEQHTLNDAIERYKQHLGLENPRRLKTVKHLLDWWSAKIGHHLLADLTQALIAEKMDDLRKQTVPNRKKGLQYTNATVNRYKSALQSCLNMAVSPWCWMEDNPAKKIKNFKEPPGRDRFLSKDELSVLLDQCLISENPYLHAIVIIALSSGARIGQASVQELRRGTPELKAFSVKQLGLALFYIEGCKVDKILTSEFLEQFQQDAEFTDAESVGLDAPSFLGLRECIEANMQKLNDIRQKKIKRVLDGGDHE